MSPDPRLAAFLTDGEEVFNGIQQGQNLWKHDPLDVPSFNARARQVFQQLLKRAVATPTPAEGRLLMLTGEAGSGKTHLMRAFRQHVHSHAQGYVGYLQMTVDTPNYERYILSCLMDSLDRPYDERTSEASGLMRLSDTIMAFSTSIHALNIQAEPRDDEHLSTTVSDVAYELRGLARFRGVDVDLLRALLFLQHRDVRVHHAVLQWLRCRELSASSARLLGDLMARTDDDGPRWLLEQLGHLFGALGQAFVLCVDQVEDMSDFAFRKEMEPAFRRAMTPLAHLAGRIPTAVVVICCLADFWVKARPTLTRAILDRIERNPEPVTLEHLLQAQTARDIAEMRLKTLYEKRGARIDPRDPTWPFPAQEFDVLSGRRMRDVLHELRRYREQAIDEGRLPPRFPLPEATQTSSGTAPQLKPERTDRVAELEQAWTDFRATFQAQVPTEDEELVSLLAWGLEASNAELDAAGRISVKTVDEVSLEIAPAAKSPRLLVVLCNRSPKGGHLGRQMEEALQVAGGKLPVLVRTTEFPATTGTIVAEQLLRLQKKGGRRAVLGDGDLRELVALRTFRLAHDEASLSEWARATRPLLRLKLLADLLGREPMVAPPAQEPTAPEDTAPARDSAPPGLVAARVSKQPPKPAPTGPLRLGQQEGVLAEPILLDAKELTRHSAFLGGSGSGKTTVALNIVEQLLLRGIPAILVDRKGDLANYAREEAWGLPLEDTELVERRRLLRERVDVALYTPGRTDGRPLAIPVVPRGLDTLPAEERDQGVQQAANAIASMLEYKNSPRDKAARALLGQALSLLVRRPRGPEVTLELLQQFVRAEDPSLVHEAEGLDPKTFARLGQDLAMLRLNTRVLLSSTGERLDLEELLGRGASGVPGRTRLSIISTKFLGGESSVLFWVSQFLLETNRWASQHPSGQLQAVLLFDEADLYLPATRQPSTKQPMENLLRRARSAGVGVMLATQSPGDFDYKCRENVRNWFVGRVTEETALKKLRPMFSQGRGADPTDRIATQRMGRFHVQREGQPVHQLHADRNVLLTEQLSEEDILHLARRSREEPGAVDSLH